MELVAQPEGAGHPGHPRAHPEHVEIRLAGTGGQGQVLASIILAEAAGIYEGYTVAQTQDYGPESRGGASKAEVVITSDREVDYPKVTTPDLLVAMSQDAYNKYCGDVKPGGVVIVDTAWVRDTSVPSPATVYRLPITDIAREKVGKALAANVVALGAVTAFLNLISLESMEKAVLGRVPKGTEEMNRQALRAGYEAAKAKRGSGEPSNERR